MSFSYHIIGGALVLDKKVFTKEMLNSTSLIKKIMNPSYKAKGAVNLIKKENQIKLTFSLPEGIDVGEDHQSIIDRLKEEYGELVSGSLTLRVEGSVSISILNLELL